LPSFALAYPASQAKRHACLRLAIGAPICEDRGMASDPKTVAFIVDQLAAAGDVSAKPMFGEYGVYCDGRMVAMICDDQLFVKPTPGGRAFAGAIDEAPPYPGAKPCLLVDADRWDDAEWMAELVRISAAELPLPKPKKPKAKTVQAN
jgi:TfoX/Sxy family transcriptional regulator of competence genes